MPDIEENEDGKLESEASDAQPQEANDAAPENTEPEASPAPAPATKQAIMYGTRKRRPGAESAPAAKTLNQIRGPVEDDDDIEMDDLVIRSTAPDHLIEGEKSDSPKGRGRRERSRQPKEEAPQEEALDNDIEAYPEDEPSQETSSEDENRPERFGKLKEDHRPRQRAVEEFRPSKDGKRSAPKKRTRPEEASTKPVAHKPKKGFFAWLKSLFGIEEEPKKQDKRRSNRGSNQRRRRRGGQNRPKGEGFDGNRSNRPRGGRRRGRGNRPQGEGGPQGEGNRQGGNRRRRRRRKPQGERNQQSAE